MKKTKSTDRLRKGIDKQLKELDDLKRINDTGATEKDLLKFKAEALGISQKAAKNLFNK